MNGIAGHQEREERGDGAEDRRPRRPTIRRIGRIAAPATRLTAPVDQADGTHSSLKRSRNGKNTAQKTILNDQKDDADDGKPPPDRR